MQAVALMLKDRISGLPIVDSSGTVSALLLRAIFLRRAELGIDTLGQRARAMNRSFEKG